MGLFGKNKKETGSNSKPNGVPSLPELPKLPELPQMPSANSPPQFSSTGSAPAARPNALPRFPSGSLGDKFSQSTIKDAVSGEKEGDVVNEFENEIQKMPLPDKVPGKKPEMRFGKKSIPLMREQAQPPRYKPEMPEVEPEEAPIHAPSRPQMMESPRTFAHARQSNEPVFIRIDKFEESMETFSRIKKQISGVDKLLNEVKQIKEKEEMEMQEWQQKLESMKSQIEKIDRDIFSKIE